MKYTVFSKSKSSGWVIERTMEQSTRKTKQKQTQNQKLFIN